MNSLDPASSPPSSRRVRVLIVDDHPVFREGIAALLGRVPDVEICGEAASAPLALDAMRRLEPDVALVDISLPGSNGLELIKAMLAERPRLKVIVLSMHDESLYALRALKAGARGYVMKSEASGSIVAAITKVSTGSIYVSPRYAEQLIYKAVQSLESGSGSPVDGLSDRELEVLQHLGHGKGTRLVANELGLSVKTIETHRAHIKEKLGLRDAAELVRFATDWVAHEGGAGNDPAQSAAAPAASNGVAGQ